MESREIESAPSRYRSAPSFWAMAGTIMLAMVALSAVLVSLPPHDLWWQLRAGQIIATEHRIPTRDPFSFSASGEPWLVQEWLSCLVFFTIQRAFGFNGLVALQVALIAIAMLGLAGACRMRGANGLWTMASTALAVWAARPWFAIRPQLFTYALLSVLLALSETYRRKENAAALIAVFPLAALWANLHAGALLAPVLMAFEAVGAGAEAVAARFRDEEEAERMGWKDAAAFGAATLGALVATLMTPHGIALWRYPGAVTRHPQVVDFITEWFSPNFHASGILPVAWLIGLLMAVLILRGPQPPYRDFPLIFFMLAIGLFYRRNLPLFSLAAAPILAGRSWDLLKEAEWSSRIRWGWIGFAACSFSLAPIAGTLARWPQRDWFAAQAGMYDFPVGAVEYLSAHPPVGPLFHDYRWGGYLIWNLPKVPVFIDGRAEVYYRKKVFDDYVTVHKLQPGWEAVLEKYQIRDLLCERWMGVVQVLLRDPNWRVIYRDPQAVVLERRPWP